MKAPNCKPGLPISLYLVGITVFLGLNCSIKIKNLDTPCKENLSFFRNVWRFNDTTSIYYFEGNPEWWYSDKYVVESCLIGMTEKEIVKLMGDPTSHCTYIPFRQMVYCLDQTCLDKILLTRGKWVQILFDSAGFVNTVHTSPSLMQRNDGWD